MTMQSFFKKKFNLLAGHVSEFFTVIGMLGLYLFPLRRFDPKENEVKKDAPLILLVHGFLHNSSAWLPLRLRLKKRNFFNVFTVDLGTIPIKSIEGYAKALQKRVREIKKTTQRSDITLIGHSMGGVVSAYYALYLAKGDNIWVTNVITLNSPLQGTKMHVFAPGRCVRQMGYRTEFIRNLSKKIKESKTTQFFHIASLADMVVRPYYSALNLDNDFRNVDPTRYYIAPNLGHAGVLYSSQISKIIVNYLINSQS